MQFTCQTNSPYLTHCSLYHCVFVLTNNTGITTIINNNNITIIKKTISVIMTGQLTIQLLYPTQSG